jgi:uncharacterized membrane protein
MSIDTDLLAFAASIFLLLAYHVHLRLRLRRNPRYTIQAINNAARAAWVENIMGNQNKDILAVQTLRNSTMAATFLASTAVLLIIGVLNLSQSGNGPIGLLKTAIDWQHPEALLHLLKLLPLMIDLFSAFFFFSLAIRIYNHVGYLINAANHPAVPADHVYVARLLNRGGAYYSLGMRSYYLFVPFVFWLVSPYLMLAASVGLLLVLNHVDRPPVEIDTPDTAVAPGGDTEEKKQREPAGPSEPVLHDQAA